MSEQATTTDHTLERTLLYGLGVVALLVASCALLFELRWETSDDIAMAMVAGGYGIAAVPSPNLVFSNVLWGHLVQLMDGLGVMPGYALASLSVLSIAGITLFATLAAGGVQRMACVATLVLLLLRPLLFQQFTINAGFATLAAVLCWHHSARHASRPAAWIGGGLLLVAFLIRAPEACLVLVIAMPLLPWTWLLRNRHAQLCLAVLTVALLAAQFVDRHAYESPAWRAFNALNLQRSAFTDFAARRAALAHPELMRKRGFSANDIDLVGSWFFVDAKVSDPPRLRALLSDLGSAPLALTSLPLATRGIKNLLHPDLVTLFAAALLLAVSQGGWRVAASWSLCLAAMLALGIAGRPSALRVYVPLLSLLVVAPLLWSRRTKLRVGVGLLVLVCAATLNGYRVASQSRAKQQEAAALRRQLETLGQEPVMTWGSAFPFEAIYPVAGPTPASRVYRLYGLGVFTLAPFSVAAAEEAAGTGFVPRFTSAGGIRMIADQRQLTLLGVYCAEHFGGILEALPTPALGTVQISQQRCQAETGSASAPH